MQSQIIALLVPQGSRKATLLVRRGDGQFALEGIEDNEGQAAAGGRICVAQRASRKAASFRGNATVSPGRRSDPGSRDQRRSSGPNFRDIVQYIAVTDCLKSDISADAVCSRVVDFVFDIVPEIIPADL